MGSENCGGVKEIKNGYCINIERDNQGIIKIKLE